MLDGLSDEVMEVVIEAFEVKTDVVELEGNMKFVVQLVSHSCHLLQSLLQEVFPEAKEAFKCWVSSKAIVIREYLESDESTWLRYP